MTAAVVVEEPSALTRLVAAAPPGLDRLDPVQENRLRKATGDLLLERAATSAAELARFEDIRARQMTIDPNALLERHQGRSILVTGGTGCIGSALLQELVRLHPRRVVSISRGVERGWPRHAGVEYLEVDVRDGPAVAELVATVKPDLVYHLAAQHEPGLAEREVARTLSTNVLGTINVVQATSHLAGTHVAVASTGKALRPFSRDIYAASKKMVERVLAEAAGRTSATLSAVRFTHVVDNSIILRRLWSWSNTGAPVRLHNPDTMFYLQSAREAAQLLLSSVLRVVPGRLHLFAIRDLGWPVSLLDLALGVIAVTGTTSPLYLCGPEAGYQDRPYPALYDAMVSGCRSPLFNALEAFAVQDWSSCEDVDAYPVTVDGAGGLAVAIAGAAARAASGESTRAIRVLVEEVGWAMWESTLRSVPEDSLHRHLSLIARCDPMTFSPDDQRVAGLVRQERDRRLHGAPRRAPFSISVALGTPA